MDYRNRSTEELKAAKFAAQCRVRALEKRGYMRTSGENQELKQCRAAVREISKELAKRYVQLPLL